MSSKSGIYYTGNASNSQIKYHDFGPIVRHLGIRKQLKARGNALYTGVKGAEDLKSCQNQELILSEDAFFSSVTSSTISSFKNVTVFGEIKDSTITAQNVEANKIHFEGDVVYRLFAN